MKRLFILFCAGSPLLTGCATQGKKLKILGESEYKAGNYEGCAAHYREAAQLEEGDTWNVGYDYHHLAQCLKAQAKNREAVAELENAVTWLNRSCHEEGTVADASFRQQSCHQAADDSELLAQWKKELGAGAGN